MPAENCHHRFDAKQFHGHWGFEFDIDSYDWLLSLRKMIAIVFPWIYAALRAHPRSVVYPAEQNGLSY